MVLVSYIIPSYNSAQYIINGLDSIYKTISDQSLYEIIVINDGSNDNTTELLSEYIKNKNNITILYQDNQGQSVARNLGIETAKGEYIYFMDADDTLSPQAYLPEQTLRKGEYDIIGIEVEKVNLDGEIQPYCHQKHDFGTKYEKSIDYLKRHNILGIVYGYYFKREFILRSNLRFTPGIYHQDEEFVAKAFCYGGAMTYQNITTYHYHTRKGSCINTNTRERREKLMRDSLFVMKSLCSMSEYSEALDYKLNYYTSDMIRLLIRQQHDMDFAMEIISELKKLGRYPLPWISDIKLIIFKIITISPAIIRFWIKHPLRIF